MESHDLVGWIQQMVLAGATAKIAVTMIGGAGFVPVAALLALKMAEDGGTGKNGEGRPSSRQVSRWAGELRRSNLDVRKVRGQFYVRIQPPSVEIGLTKEQDS